MTLPFCFTTFLTENKALKKHNMKSLFLRIVVGMDKANSWLLAANHQWKQKIQLFCPPYRACEILLCAAAAEGLEGFHGNRQIVSLSTVSLLLLTGCLCLRAARTSLSFRGEIPFFSEVLKLSLCLHSDPSQTQHNDQEDGGTKLSHNMRPFL